MTNAKTIERMIHSATFGDQQTNVERCVDLLVQWDTARVYSLQNVQYVEKRVGGEGGGGTCNRTTAIMHVNPH